MSEAEDIAKIVAEQRATPEDLKPQADPPAPEPTPVEAAPVEEAPVVEATEETPPVEEAPKKKKTATDHLTSRVGNLQQRLNQEQAERASIQARLEAAEALLNARGTPAPDGTETPPAPSLARTDINPNTARAYTPEEFRAAVAETARVEALNAKANAVYENGTAAFPDFQETVSTLGALGVMTGDFIEAAITAAGDEKTSAALFHALGADVDEATRISQLPPVRMGVELAKLAASVAKPTQTRVSATPAPIPSIRGAVEPTIDLARAAGGDNDMSAWVAARQAAGDPFARAPGRRH